MSLLLGFFVRICQLYTGFELTLNCKPKGLTSAVLHKNGGKCFSNNTSNIFKSKRNQKYSNGKHIRNSTALPNGANHKTINNGSKVNFPSLPIHWPVFTILITLCQWACYELGNIYANNGWVSEKDVETNHLKRHQIWRLFTSLFVHDGEEHLWNNLLEQMVFGCCLELVHGWKPVLLLYFGGSLVADLADLLGGTGICGCGASGALLAILAGNLVTLFLNSNIISGAFIRGVMLSIYVFAELTVSFWYPALLRVFGPELEDLIGVKLDNDISHSSHIGGFIGGFVFSFCLFKSFRKIPYKIEMKKLCRYLAVILLVLGLGSLFYNPLFSSKYLQRMKLQGLGLTKH